MITLIQAVRLCGLNNDDIVKLVDLKDVGKYYTSFYQHYTVKEMRNKLDMRKIKVARIRPWYSFYEYEGFEFHVTGLG